MKRNIFLNYLRSNVLRGGFAYQNALTETALCQPVRTHVNLLTSNVNYSGRSAPLTSKVALYIFIQQI